MILYKVGLHGILIEFTVSKMVYSATYLPEVASSQRWNQEKAVHSLIRKAGFSGEKTRIYL